MITKKRYLAIAAKLRKLRPHTENMTGTEAWNAIVSDLANIFKNDNPKFDQSRFYEACGKTVEKPREI